MKAHETIVTEILDEIEDQTGLEPVRRFEKGKEIIFGHSILGQESGFYFPDAMEFEDWEAAIRAVNPGDERLGLIPTHRIHNDSSKGTNLALQIITYYKTKECEAAH